MIFWALLHVENHSATVQMYAQVLPSAAWWANLPSALEQRRAHKEQHSLRVARVNGFCSGVARASRLHPRHKLAASGVPSGESAVER